MKNIISFLTYIAFFSSSSACQASEKFPWYALPRELKWHILTIGSDSALSTIMKDVPQELKDETILEIQKDETTRVSAISPDGNYLAVACKESNLGCLSRLRVYNLKSRTLTCSMKVNRTYFGYIQCIAWHPTKNKIACGIDSVLRTPSSFMVWDIDTNSQTFADEGCQLLSPTCISWHPTKDELIMGGRDGLYHWDGNTVSQISSAKCITHAKWNRQGDKIAYSSFRSLPPSNPLPQLVRYFHESLLTILDHASKEKILESKLSNKPTTLEWRPDGTALMLGTNYPYSCTFNLQDQRSTAHSIYCKEHQKLSFPKSDTSTGYGRPTTCLDEPITAIKWHPNNSLFAIAREKAKLSIGNNPYSFCSGANQAYPLDENHTTSGGTAIDMRWFDQGIGMLYLTSTNVKSILFNLATPALLKRYFHADKSKFAGELDFDPLKHYMTVQTISRAFQAKKAQQRNFKNQQTSAQEIPVHNHDNQLRKALQEMGLPDEEIQALLSKNCDLLLGSESYDYYLHLKDQLSSHLSELKVGLRGKDIDLSGLLAAQIQQDGTTPENSSKDEPSSCNVM